MIASLDTFLALADDNTIIIPGHGDVMSKAELNRYRDALATILDRIQGLGTCQNQIANIEGGIESWKELGLPVIRSAPTSPTISIFRQVQVIAGFLIALLVLIGFMGITLAFTLAGIIGGALFFSGLTRWCGLAIVLARMPWNK